MTTWCSYCEQWSALPADGGQGESVRVLCQHCDAPLYVEGKYRACPDCHRYHRTDYDTCPFCTVNGVSVLATVAESTLGKYTLEPKKRSAKRGNDYYWQLYLDYKDQAPTPPAETEEPPHPALGNGNSTGNGKANGISSPNGNGHASPIHPEKSNGTSPSTPSAQNGATHVDLAIADTVALTLFTDEEVSRVLTDPTSSAPTSVSAGNYNEFEYELIQDPARLAEVAEYLSRETTLGIDTETTGLDPHTVELLLLQISTADKVYIVDCRRLVPLTLKPLLENPKICKIAQNAKFEYEMLRQQVGITLSNMYDTMLAERLLTAGVSREISLKMIAHKYIGATLDKSVREAFYKLAGNGDFYLAPDQLHYAARDAFIMIPIWKLQAPLLKKERLEQVAALEFQCIAAVGDMELAGVKIDEERWRKIISDVQIQRDQTAIELATLLEPATMQATMFGVSAINLNSNTQLVDALSKLGVDLPDTMEATLSKFNHPAVTKLLEYRGQEKTLSAFGENVLGLINPKTHRIHPDFNQYGADTGRFSCLAGETLIGTTVGLKRIDTIQSGDLVQTSFGSRKVQASWSNGVRPLLKVTLSDGRSLRLTQDHRVLTGNGDTWQPIEELSVGDAMFLSLHAPDLSQISLDVPLDIDAGTYWVKRKATIPHSLSVPLCELAGLITADGTFVEDRSHRVIRGKHGVRFTNARYDRVLIDFAWEDDELIERVKEYSAALFGIPFVEFRHKTARRLQLASTQVSNSLANLGLAGTAHTKKVPDAIFTAPAMFQAAYLRGLFEGDGHITKAGNHIGLTSVNLTLLERAQTMLSFLGCHASIRMRKDSSGFSGSPRYELGLDGIENVSRFMSVIGFMSSRKNERICEIASKSAGSLTPIRISGSRLYREAVSSGLLTPSRRAVKPFIQYYKATRNNTATLDKLLTKWGDLPELAQAKTYRQRELHPLRIVSIEADGTEPVYDLTVEDVSEFLANGLVVHNCTRPNVQQIPATSDFRKCFVAPEGYKLVTCVAEGTRIATSRGMVPVESVQEGDRVFQEDGSTRLVQRAIDQGQRPTLMIRTALGYELTATPEHKMRILDDEGNYVWQEACHLQLGAVVAIRTGKGCVYNGARPALPNSTESHFNAVNRTLPVTLTEDLALLLGYLAGDGTFIHDYVGWVVNEHDRDVVNHLYQLSKTLFADEPKRYSYRGVVDQRIYSIQIKRWLESIGASTRRVPDMLLTSPESVISSYLQGLFESDGSVQSTATGKISFSTVHEEMAREVQALLRFVGIVAIRRRQDHDKGCGFIWSITIPSAWNEEFARRVGFLSARKRLQLDMLLTRKVKQETGAMPNLRQKLRAAALRPDASRDINTLLANARNRGSVVTVALAERVKTQAPQIADFLGLHHILDNGLIFDKIVEVSPSGDRHVFDLTVEETSTYITEGFISHNCDYSQAELRILAELSGDEGFVTAFQSGGDLHSLTASQMFGVPLEEVQKPQRNAAKAINFGLAYGMGPGGLAPRLGVTLDESKELIARYFKAYPGVQKWLEKAGKDAVRNGYSSTTLGRKRYYNIPDESLKRISEDDWRKQIGAIERQGKNSPIQGCIVGSTRIFDKENGYTQIEKLCGRAVSVWDGEQFSNATVVYSGKKQLIKVRLRGGHYIECSPDHRFLVACNNGYKWVWKWKPITEIKAQNRIALTQPVGEWHLPLDIQPVTAGASWNANSASLTQFTDLRQMGEWLGRLASDGSLADGAVSMLVAEHEEAILPQLQLATAELGHVGHSIRTTETQPKRFHRLTISSRGLVRQLRDMGVKEHIPACAWRDSTLLSAYLRGLFDGDGTVHPDGALLTFGQGDKHLSWAREVQEALLLFGIRSRINAYTNENHRINLRVLKRDMPLFCERVGFINPAKQERAMQIHAAERWERVSPQYGMAMLVDSIEVTDEYVDMYDVVNSDTGRFMANGMVVHNCNADMTKIALIFLRNALKGWDARTVNTVHDEIVVEVREDQAEEVKHIVEDAMVRAGEVILKVVPIVAEASLADYWSK